MQMEIRLFISWYTLPLNRNLKFTFEFQTPLAQNSSAGTQELVSFDATRIYVGIVNYVVIFLLVPWNYFLLAPTCISLVNENSWRFLLGDSSLLSLVWVYYYPLSWRTKYFPVGVLLCFSFLGEFHISRNHFLLFVFTAIFYYVFYIKLLSWQVQ